MRDLNMQVGELRLENEEVVRQVTDAVNECNEQRVTIMSQIFAIN